MDFRLGSQVEAFRDEVRSFIVEHMSEELEEHSAAFVYTPVHGSWLNVAEIELSALARQCLDRRIPDMDALGREVAAWEKERNAAGVVAEWQFTTAEARTAVPSWNATWLPVAETSRGQISC